MNWWGAAGFGRRRVIQDRWRCAPDVLGARLNRKLSFRPAQMAVPL